MLIDRKAKPWFFISLAIFLIATGVYIPYSRGAFGPGGGGSWGGLIYGVIGSAAMLITFLLALRKARKIRTKPFGRVYYWMQAHVWLGLLSYPLILYHAGGFAWGGPLTQTIMWLFTIVMISGVVGIGLQQVIPRQLMREAPAETIYDQIDHVLLALRTEAEAIVRPVRAERESARAEEADQIAGGSAVATMVARSSSAIDPFEAFYTTDIVPFMQNKMPPHSVLGEEASADDAFEQWRSRLPLSLHAATMGLQSLVAERRQLARQRRLHRQLHGWLLIHVPLSYVLIALAVVHAIMASRYMRG